MKLEKLEARLLLTTLPMRGSVVPELSAVDDVLQAFFSEHPIPGGAVAISQGGRIVYERSIGYRDASESVPLEETTMMRLASVSKPITATAIRELVHDGKLTLNTPAFDIDGNGGVLQITPFGGELGDSRLKDITVGHLLLHQGGWNRVEAGDLAGGDLSIAQKMGVPSPPGIDNRASYILSQPLQFAPGTETHYSNVGFMFLGMIVEARSNSPFENYVKERVFSKHEIPPWEVVAGRTFAVDQDPREPRYASNFGESTNVFDPAGPRVPRPYGGWHHEAYLSFGGLVSSAKALAMLASERVVAGPQIGNPLSVFSPTSSYGWSHTGSFDGTNSIIRQRQLSGTGFTYAILLNRRHVEGTNYAALLRPLLDDALFSVDRWPQHLIYAGDFTGDQWHTGEDVFLFSEAVRLGEAEFATHYPAARYLAGDFTGDGTVDGDDILGMVSELRYRGVPDAMITPLFELQDRLNSAPVFEMDGRVTFEESTGELQRRNAFIRGLAPGGNGFAETLPGSAMSLAISPTKVPHGLISRQPEVRISEQNGWPKSADLIFYSSPHAFGEAAFELTATLSHPTGPISTSSTFTVLINPVNDPPVAFGRTLTVREAVEADDETAVLEFTAADLIVGGPGETPGRPADLPPSVPPPFDESEQALRVVAFAVPGQPAVDAADLPGGSGTVSRSLPSGGEIRFTFAGGEFVSGSYTPPVDFNEHPIFGGSDTFTYIIEDDGKTTIPGGDGVPLFLPPQRSQPATVTLRVLPANDPPDLQTHAAVHLLEHSGDGVEVIPGWATRIAPGPPTALDESLRQSVTLDFVPELSQIPPGLFHADPQVSSQGTLTLFPAAHAVGSAEIVIRASDHEPTPGFTPRSTLASVTVHVQPVNDPPRLVAERIGTGGSIDAVRAWQVTSQGAIRFTLPEDNTGPGGDTSQDFFIPLESQGGSSHQPIGLLDLFDVGPANEQDGTDGGNQTLSLVDDFPRATLLGGQLTLGSLDGRPGVFYRPPRDANLLTDGIDYFDYTVTDDGRSYRLGDTPFVSGTFVDDPKTIRGHVQLRLNPINDPPVFVGAPDVASDEGDGLVTIPDWATEIRPGPETAVDEVIGRPDAQPPIPPQSVEFLISPVPDQWQTRFDPLFTIPPTVTIQGETATLSYQAAPHANGIAVFDIVLMDDGPHDPQRGDIHRSEPVRFTISVAAVNDPPQFEPGGEVSIGADRGPYAAPWATEVLPGPPAAIDELAEQTVWFEWSLPEHGHELFTADGLPTLGGDGMLRFTPAPEAQGQILIDVVAVDSLGARSEPAVLTITLAGVPGPPLVTDDRVGTYRGNALDIDLSAGAIPGAAEIDPASIEIVTPPGAGELEMLGDGRVRYVAAADASGDDRFTFRIRDIDGRISEPATVTVLIATSPLQNPLRHADVNADGEVTALDALLVINHISRYGSGGTPTTAPDDGGWFYDVNGDGVVTALDALLVINHIARGDAPGEGEGPGEREDEGPQVAPTPARLATPSRFVVLGSAETDVRRSDAIFRPDDDESGLSGLAGERLASPWRPTEGLKVAEKSDPSAISGDRHDRVDWSAFAKRSADTADLLFEDYELDLLVRRG